MNTITAVRVGEIVEQARAYGESVADLLAVGEEWAAEGEAGVAATYKRAAWVLAQ